MTSATWMFLLGSGWILLAIVLLLGRTAMRTQPLMYAVFGIGAWLYPSTYHALIAVCVFLALASFSVIWFRRGHGPPSDPPAGVSAPKRANAGEWLKMLAIIAGIVFLVVALPPTVTYLSLTVLNRMKDSPTSPALVVAVEQKLRGEILQRLAESGWKPETLSVSVSPDLRRAECHLGRLWKNGLTQEPPWLAAVRITRQRPGLWLVQGEGEFHTLRFSVDTTP